MEKNKKWLNIQDLSDYLKVSKSTIYKRTMKKTLPFHRFGGKLLFEQTEIDNFISQSKEDPSNLGITVEK